MAARVGDDPKEVSGVTTRLIVEYVRAAGGEPAVGRLLAAAGDRRSAEQLCDESTWSSYEAMIALFDAAVTVTGDPDAPRRIGESALDSVAGRSQKLALRLLGSPQRVLRTVASVSGRLSAFSEMTARTVDRNHAVVTQRTFAGYRPSRHDCGYTVGLLSQAPALFGLPTAVVIEQACQALGAPECVYRLSWQDRRRRRLLLTGGRRSTERELRVLREQMASLQRTTADLVSPVDVDTVLARITQRASSAVQAQRILLAVELGGQLRVQATGFDEETAQRLGARLVADPHAEQATCSNECVIAEVASARTRYGWVAAFFPPATASAPAEQELWDAYARLAAAALDMATALDEARCRGETAETLLRLGRALAAAEEPDEVAQRLATAVPGLTGADRGTVLLWCPRLGGMAVHGAYGYEPAEELRVRALVITPEDTPVIAGLVARPGPLLFRSTTTDPWVRQVLEEYGVHTLAVVPIILRGDVLGAAVAGWATSPEPRADAELFGRLGGLADQAATALGNANLIQQARHAATHDELTGLPNRTLLADRLAQADATRRRTGGGLALLFLDLDGFKEINDVWGHAAGDTVLKEVAHRLRAGVRATDTVARYGGDEFLVLLSDIDDREDAEFVASALLASLAPPIRVGDRELAIGASLGVALSFGNLGAEDLLREADAAMYRAKAAGRTADRTAFSLEVA